MPGTNPTLGLLHPLPSNFYAQHPPHRRSGLTVWNNEERIMSKRIPRLRAMAAASAAAACLLASTQASWATAPPAISEGDTYVALGSSFAAGGAPEIIDPYCGRSGNNYAHIAARELGLELTDVTCGGATINNILDTPQRVFTGAYQAPQLNAVGYDTDLITITAGGNDVNYIGGLSRESCLADPTAFDAIADPYYRALIKAGTCGGVTDRAANQELLDGLDEEWTLLLDAVRERAPQARIVIIDYATLLPQSGQGCDQSPLSREQSKYFLDVAHQLQLITKSAAQHGGAELVEMSKYSRHHDACSSEPWVSGWDVSKILGGGPGPWHPNAAGVQATADLLIAHLKGSGSSAAAPQAVPPNSGI
jgi:lysophospholipase L1-like esterase